MFNIVFILGLVFITTLILANLWVKLIHPFLFEEAIEDKLDDAVETRVMREADKKAAEILNQEEA